MLIDVFDDPPQLRSLPVSPVYPTLTLMPPGSSRCRSTEYCCTRGAPLFGSTKKTSPPVPVRSPSVLPLVGVRPFGNGLLIDTVGTPLGCGTGVVAEYPICPQPVVPAAG